MINTEPTSLNNEIFYVAIFIENLSYPYTKPYAKPFKCIFLFNLCVKPIRLIFMVDTSGHLESLHFAFPLLNRIAVFFSPIIHSYPL